MKYFASYSEEMPQQSVWGKKEGNWLLLYRGSVF